MFARMLKHQLRVTEEQFWQAVRSGVPPESLDSPGLGIRHYAPRATLMLVEDDRAMKIAIEQLIARGERVGLMLPDGWLNAEQLRGCTVFSWGQFS